MDAPITFEPERRDITLASRVLQGGPVALVTTRHHGASNVLPVAWHTPLSTDPPLVGIAIERSRHSLDLISHSQEFAINIPTRALLHHVQYLGSLTGRHVDKLEATQMETFAPTHITAPLLRGCLAWVECEVVEAIPVGDHTLFVGLVRAVHVDPDAFTDRWLPEAAIEHRPLHYLGGTAYAALYGVSHARLPRDAEAPDRVLAERAAEELELTAEARERRAEELGRIRDEVEAGRIVDVSALGDAVSGHSTSDALSAAEIDLSRGFVLGE